ncbi:MAG: deoxyribodipyrimidine photo-lyase [Thermocrinis sp.]|jgi:deoxyribodipyrimidine photo-lyase|uniref:deoxyribodipyrimidine photo-lyase n=1 Tax=Thermocrinis sp. TaxID=2024383 RepID=UPI003C0CF84B
MEQEFAGRVKVINRRQFNTNGKYIIYWMSHSHRAHFNHSLEFAIELSNQSGKPLLVYFPITDKYKHSNARYYKFMLDGILEAKKSVEERGIKFAIEKVNDIKRKIIELSENAYALITDKAYLKYYRKLNKYIADGLDVPVFEIESDVCVPVEIASDKQEHYAFTFRKKIYSLLDKYIIELKPREPKIKSVSFDFGIEEITFNNSLEILNILNIDKSVSLSPFVGGYSQARKYLEEFIEKKLHRYKEFRSHPELDYQSNLSPYLHFGQISPIEVVLEVLSKYGRKDENVDSFFNELIVWRELARNFCYYNPNYNQYEGIPDWAKETLEEHKNDKREYIYTIEDLENAKTHDEYWNSAQLELLKTGKMHNYMRMYWCKKLIEWTDDPKKAFDIACYLNDKYELDGRDPNGYAGISWCFGTHDRPWKERKIFGKVRYMSASGLEAKFDIKKYVEKVKNL